MSVNFAAAIAVTPYDKWIAYCTTAYVLMLSANTLCSPLIKILFLLLSSHHFSSLFYTIFLWTYFDHIQCRFLYSIIILVEKNNTKIFLFICLEQYKWNNSHLEYLLMNTHTHTPIPYKYTSYERWYYILRKCRANSSKSTDKNLANLYGNAVCIWSISLCHIKMCIFICAKVILTTKCLYACLFDGPRWFTVYAYMV